MDTAPVTIAPAIPDPRRIRAIYLLHVWLLVALAILLSAAIEWDYILSIHFGFLRIDCIAGAMAGCVGVAACLGGAMHFLDRALVLGFWWPCKFILLIQQRLMMIGQLLVMALCVYAAALLVFHLQIPGFDDYGPPPHALIDG